MQSVTPFVRVFAVFAALNLAAALMYYLGIYRPTGAYELDFYVPYIFLSGPAWFLAMPAQAGLTQILELSFGSLSFEFRFIWLSGLTNAICGAIQWWVLIVVASGLSGSTAGDESNEGAQIDQRTSVASMAIELSKSASVGALPCLVLVGIAVWSVDPSRPWGGSFAPLENLVMVPLPIAVAGGVIAGFYVVVVWLSFRRVSGSNSQLCGGSSSA